MAKKRTIDNNSLSELNEKNPSRSKLKQIETKHKLALHKQTRRKQMLGRQSTEASTYTHPRKTKRTTYKNVVYLKRKKHLIYLLHFSFTI